MEQWDFIEPTEANGYRLFPQELEDNQLVFFHATPKRHLDSIVENGFRSAESLGVGTLQSVSYAMKSSACLAHLQCAVNEDYVVLAVRFESLEDVKVNLSDIHIYKQEIQPEILGYCVLPAGFHVV